MVTIKGRIPGVRIPGVIFARAQKRWRTGKTPVFAKATAGFEDGLAQKHEVSPACRLSRVIRWYSK